MYPFIIITVIFLVLSVYLIWLFLTDIIYLLINIPILWFVLVRSYFEVRHKKIFYPYLSGVGITTLLFSLAFDHIQIEFIFWPVLFITIVFIIAEIINLGIYFNEKYEIISSFSKKRTS